jgi:outer membrane protein assembly factor BamB
VERSKKEVGAIQESGVRSQDSESRIPRWVYSVSCLLTPGRSKKESGVRSQESESRRRGFYSDFCLLTPVSLLLLTPVSLFSQNWPSFRGEHALGVVQNAKLPTSWDVEKGRNVAWNITVPGLAHSSPIVWGDRIYLTTAVSADPNSVLQYPLKGELDTRTDTSKHQFRVMAIDKASGKIVWDKLAYDGEPKVARHPHNSYAAATPATDGKHVVAFFGSVGLYGFDAGGKLLWKQDVGILDQAAFDVPDYKWGYASSPIIYKNLAIIQCDQIKGSFMAAFDVDTGKQTWRIARPDAIPSWATPGIYEGKSGAELIANGAEYVRGYDPMTGKELWSIKGTSMISVPTPFAVDDLIYVFTGYWRFIQPIYVIKPGARGDITPPKDAATTDQLAWTTQKGAPYLNTPVIYGEYLYVMGNTGILVVYRARTGERIYQQRLGNGGYFTASAIAAGGKIYFTDEDGDVFVVKAGATYELLSENHMGEVTMATPAIAGNTLLFRTQHRLYALKESN